MDMLEEQVSDEIDPVLNEEEYIRIEDSRDEHWRDGAEDGKDKSNILALSWGVYTILKEGLIKR